MRFVNRLTGGAMALFRRKRADAELDEELQGFLAASIDAKLARGMSRDAAERAARLELGSSAAVRDWVRDVGWESRVESIWYDIRFAARILSRSPGFAVVAILTLALGTGANAAIFQLLNAVRFQPLPVEQPHDLVSIGMDMHGKGRVGMGYRRGIYTEPLWQEIRSHQQAFSSLFAWGTTQFDLSAAGEVVPAQGLYVSGAFFEALGVRAHAGRLLTSTDDQRGCGTPGAVLSHGFWQGQYGGDPGVIGQTITLSQRPFLVFGVAPPGFFGVEVGRSFDVAIPLCAEPLIRGERAGTGKPAVWWLDIMGRLKPGWTAQQVAAHLAAISRGVFEATVPPSYNAETAANYRSFTLTATPAASGVSTIRAQYSTHLWLLLAGTGLVLLIACVNLTNLMLARATARDREVAMRLAMGASRGRVVRQMLAESALVAGAGVLAGLLVATWLSRSLVALLGGEESRIFLDLTPDWRVFGFIAALAAIASLLFGLAPALRVTGTNPGQALQAGGRTATDARAALGLRRGLVVCQVAISVVLVVAALLFARSLQNLGAVELGFHPDVLAAYLDLTRTAVPTEGRRQVLADILARIRSVPAVRHAAEALIVPLSGSDWNERIAVGGVVQDGEVRFNAVGTDYFRALEMPLLAGRTFDGQDAGDAPMTAVVNEAFVKRYFPTGDPLGRTFQMDVPPGRPQPTYRIIGVVRNTKYRDVREEYFPIAYLAMAQEPQVSPIVGLVVRGDLPPASVKQALTAAITDAAPGVSVSYDTVTQYIRVLMRTDRVMTTLAGFFGLLALLIAVVGLYGVMSYTVTRRKVEIGIRMALGADAGGVVRMMLTESGTLLAMGGILGFVLAAIAAPQAARLLYGVTPFDPASFALAIAALGSVGLLASWIPARRASRVAPTIAIRE